MNPELESRLREVLTKVLAREDFPAVLVSPISEYLVTGTPGRVHMHWLRELQAPASPRPYTCVYWTLYYLHLSNLPGIEDYLDRTRLHLSGHDS